MYELSNPVVIEDVFNEYFLTLIWTREELGSRFTEEPQLGQYYWYVTSNGGVVSSYWDRTYSDEWRFKNLVLWKTEEECERYSEINDFIRDKARAFEYGEKNYFLYYEKDYDINIEYDREVVRHGELYFDKDDVDEILNEFTTEELNKYYFLIEE